MDRRSSRPRPALGRRPAARGNRRLPGPRQLRRPQPHPARGTAPQPRWRDLLGDDAVRAGVHPPERYLDALVAAGCTPDVWETTYRTLLPGPDPVLDWVKGTALRPVLTRLADPDRRAAFLAEYGALLREAYPAGPHGTVFPFRRIFAVGIRE